MAAGVVHVRMVLVISNLVLMKSDFGADEIMTKHESLELPGQIRYFQTLNTP
jgi:hypothetical protein